MIVPQTTISLRSASPCSSRGFCRNCAKLAKPAIAIMSSKQNLDKWCYVTKYENRIITFTFTDCLPCHCDIGGAFSLGILDSNDDTINVVVVVALPWWQHQKTGLRLSYCWVWPTLAGWGRGRWRGTGIDLVLGYSLDVIRATSHICYWSMTTPNLLAFLFTFFLSLTTLDTSSSL